VQALTFVTAAAPAPSYIGAAVFLVPGTTGIVLGVLTWFGLSWINNPANGLLMGCTGLVWAGVGLGILRFQRWVLVDPGRRVVERGTRTLFRHPGDRHPFEDFERVDLVREPLPGGTGGEYFTVSLVFAPGRRSAEQGPFWVKSYADGDEARRAAAAIAAGLGRPWSERSAGPA
jgi:hypothetical protein